MSESRKPNVLFVFTDQHRSDVMGCAGHPLVQTPNLDRLAGEGMRFERTWSQCPVCQPARANVITGRYAHELGIVGNTRDVDSLENEPYDPNWPTVMKQMQAAGYETATIGKTHYHSRPGSAAAAETGESLDSRKYWDFTRSFGWDYLMEEYDKYAHVSEAFVSPYMEYLASHGVLDAYQEQIRGVYRRTPTHWRGETSVLPQEHELTSFIAGHAMEWLSQRDSDKPFFLKLSFVQPHVPLIDDAIWAAYYKDADIEVPDLTPPEAVNEHWRKKLAQMGIASQAPTVTEDFVRKGIRHYLGAVSLVDQKIGEVRATLEELGEWENTWVIYSADHGEMLGDHRYWAKSNFYQGAVQLPLIVSGPDREGKGVSRSLKELIDVPATIADIGGAPAPEGCRGRSLLPDLRGEGEARDFIFSRIGEFSAVRNDRYRFTMHAPTETPCELFDLEEDSGEMTNRVQDPDSKGLVEMFTETLRGHLAS